MGPQIAHRGMNAGKPDVIGIFCRRMASGVKRLTESTQSNTFY
jgi:hypothetical protein